MQRFFVSCVFSCSLLLVGAAHADGIASLGVEGFRDSYKEPDAGLNNTANYGSVTGSYVYSGQKAFVGTDGRISYGHNDYSSESGTLSGVPQWETELRGRVGANVTFWDGDLSPYVGLGTRYFIDEGKGTVSNLGALGYDRRIIQLYVPIGVTYSYFAPGGWTLTPNLEYDQLVYGDVNSRYGNIGLSNVNNTQTSGYGVRGEFMVGQAYDKFAWQFGPFIRYWHINASNVASVPFLPPNEGIEEPKNTRTQAGLTLRVLW